MIPDHPFIRYAEINGCAPWTKGNPVCPVCGEECETVYKNRDWEIVGCDVCIRQEDACEVLS